MCKAKPLEILWYYVTAIDKTLLECLFKIGPNVHWRMKEAIYVFKRYLPIYHSNKAICCFVGGTHKGNIVISYLYKGGLEMGIETYDPHSYLFFLNLMSTN